MVVTQSKATKPATSAKTINPWRAVANQRFLDGELPVIVFLGEVSTEGKVSIAFLLHQ
jgi:hypothetical protein